MPTEPIASVDAKTAPDAPQKRFHSIRSACAALDCSRSHLYVLEKRGLVKFSKLLGKTVISASELDRLVAAVEAGEAA